MQERSYDHALVEEKWQKAWEAGSVFRVSEDSAREAYYCLEMFPYPSGRIHMGHVRNYAIGDVVARFQRMNGRNVLHPMGWDAFGMPAENAAIERRIHPAVWTRDNIAYMGTQLRRLGLSYDWSRELTTCDPEYYRWNQWFFLKMLERGLAYRKKAPVNWCGKCQTILANEQVEEGNCWRCGQEVVLRDIDGWFFRTTAYAEELLGGCDRLQGRWPESVLVQQRNWIGRSEGAEVVFPFVGRPGGLAVFTTRVDTLFGATFVSLAPEHPLASDLCRGTPVEGDVLAFIEKSRRADNQARTAGDLSKEGIHSGAWCRNPVTGEDIPIYLANFVLMAYGTGAVMAVPAHDQRDFDFAVKYGLLIRRVVLSGNPEIDSREPTEATVEDGILTSSGEFDGMESAQARQAIVAHLEGRGLGKAVVNYRLRDWGISRQRYWGTPIPVVHCEACGVVPVPYEQLPVVLPEDITFQWEGGSPLARTASFYETTCPACGRAARRDTDTMDTFVDSSWYFIRYTAMPDPREAFDRSKAEYWMPVDQYIGGVEHAILHLMYARFFTKVIRDLGLIDVDEPFAHLLTQGMVCKESYHCSEHGYLFPEEADEHGCCRSCSQPVTVGRREKMSKSKKNVVDPDRLIGQYGADTARLFSLFAAPPEKNLDWSDEGVEGASRFLKRVWRLVHRWRDEVAGVSAGAAGFAGLECTPEMLDLRRIVHQTIRRVTRDIGQRFRFNTAISAMMELVNALVALESLPAGGGCVVVREALESLLTMLTPFAPHIAEELWEVIGGEGLVSSRPWPAWDAGLVAEEVVTVVIQVNGRVRGRIEFPADAGEDEVRQTALDDPQIQRHLQGVTVQKAVYIPGRLMNFVVR